MNRLCYCYNGSNNEGILAARRFQGQTSLDLHMEYTEEGKGYLQLEYSNSYARYKDIFMQMNK